MPSGRVTLVAVKKIRTASGHDDDDDGPELAAQERLGALLDRLGDLAHLGRALVGGEHAPDQEQAGDDADQRRRPGPTTSQTLSVPPRWKAWYPPSAARLDHAWCSLSVPAVPLIPRRLRVAVRRSTACVTRRPASRGATASRAGDASRGDGVRCPRARGRSTGRPDEARKRPSGRVTCPGRARLGRLGTRRPARSRG